MTRTVFSSGLLVATLLTGGCATKKYVQNTTAPIQAKLAIRPARTVSRSSRLRLI